MVSLAISVLFCHLAIHRCTIQLSLITYGWYSIRSLFLEHILSKVSSLVGIHHLIHVPKPRFRLQYLLLTLFPRPHLPHLLFTCILISLHLFQSPPPRFPLPDPLKTMPTSRGPTFKHPHSPSQRMMINARPISVYNIHEGSILRCRTIDGG